jgi:hypothetical protein
MPAGRPSTYTPEIAEEICARLANGESLNRICRDEQMPDRTTVQLWVITDREGFSRKYTRSREIGLDVMAEDLLDIADDGRNDLQVDEEGARHVDMEHINRSRLRVDTRKWYLSKLAPKRYGDTLKLQGDAEAPLKMIVERMDRPK